MSLIAPELEYEVRDFSWGFQSTPEADILPPGATPDAKNCLFTSPQDVPYQIPGMYRRRAILSKRSGHSLLTPSALVASGTPVDGLFEFRREGVTNGQLVGVSGGKALLFDNVNTFNAIGASTPFTAGNTPRAAVLANLLFLMDGSGFQFYDGTSLFGVGFAAPTAAPALAASGTGLTGTYTGVATWWDDTHQHESSATAEVTAVTLTNQGRQWTKPTGSPPANVTHWKVYCRRTDTNETVGRFVAKVAIATTSVTETVSDTTRLTADVQPIGAANDPPPGNFALMGLRNGYALGVLANSSFIYPSAQGDAQSYDASQALSVEPGSGKGVTTILNFGTDTIVQKDERSYRLTGDAMPFTLETIEGSLGNVSQEAAVDALGSLYAWDRVKGPYRTDTGATWTPLADKTIAATLDTINVAELGNIRAFHAKALGCVGWCAATGSSARRRTIFLYNYLLGSWLPPMTGLEWSAFTTFLTSGGTLALYCGDYWGRVFQMFTGTNDGVPAATTTTATVTAATSSTATCAAAAFDTTGDGLAGLPVAVIGPAGDWQWAHVQSNTATQITLDTTHGSPWATTPNPAAGTWTLVVGGIDWYWQSAWIDFGKPQKKKRLGFLFVQTKPTSSSFALQVSARFDDNQGTQQNAALTFDTGVAGGWGTGTWGTLLWGTSGRHGRKQRVGRSAFTVQFQLANAYPDQPMDVTMLYLGADELARRWALSEVTA